MKVLQILFFAIVIVTSSASAWSETRQADALSLAVGTWGTENDGNNDDPNLETYRKCAKNPVVITVDRKNMRYKAVHTGEDYTAEGDVLAVGQNYFSIQYDDEDRLMNNGELQIWHMVFVNYDRFYWVVGPGIGENERDGIVAAARIRCQAIMA